MGGFSGVEAEPGSTAMDSVEILSLSPESGYLIPERWCQVAMGQGLVKLEGATMDWVSVMDHMEDTLSTGSTYSSPHSDFIWEKVLICGGADEVVRT